MFKKFLEGTGTAGSGQSAPLSLEIQGQGGGYYCLIDESGEQGNAAGIAVSRFELLGPDRFAITTPAGERVEGRYHIADDRYFLHIKGRTYRYRDVRSEAGDSVGSGAHRTPMPGKVLAINVSAGDTVEAGQTLMVVEAMKMENAIKAACAGKVTAVNCATGDIVNPEDVLVQIESAASAE
ncbi:MAG: acetyl-CoA carboxylase biotin carboxyl carrier protein subunit [bacterium]|nr:acetyl-CoA carboxylase biotin carboxyl carrier protein subunit [bacterium]